LEDHRARLDAYVGWREAHRRGLLDHIQAGVHAAGRVPEVEHPSVAQPPDRASAPAAGDVLDEGCELSWGIGGESIAAFLGQPGVPGEIHEADRRRLRDVALDPLGVQRGLHMGHGVVGPRMDSVGAEMGAAIRRQPRSGTVRHGDRGLTQML
jgi:hypothetical protein